MKFDAATFQFQRVKDAEPSDWMNGARLIVQPKLNGIRGLYVHGVGAFTRDRKNNTAVRAEHLDGLEFFDDSGVEDGVILDGEFYSHGRSLGEICKATRSKTPPDWLTFVPFCRVDTGENIGGEVVSDIDSKLEIIGAYKEAGYEGAIFRPIKPDYSKPVLRWKFRIQDDFLVLERTAKGVICQGFEEHTFACVADAWPGQMVRLSYCDVSLNGIPLQAQVVGVVE